jgi:hypothetical protein
MDWLILPNFIINLNFGRNRKLFSKTGSCSTVNKVLFTATLFRDSSVINWIATSYILAMKPYLSITYNIYGSRYNIYGSRYNIYGSRYNIYGSRYNIYGSRYNIYGSRREIFATMRLSWTSRDFSHANKIWFTVCCIERFGHYRMCRSSWNNIAMT